MKKYLYLLIIMLCSIFGFGQNVGIGTDNPSEKLEVEGGIKADSLDVQSGVIKNVADPISAQDAATKAYVDLLESTLDSLESRLALLTNAPVAEDDNLIACTIIANINVDLLDSGTPDSDPDGAFRYGNFIEITNVGSSPGSSDNLSKKGRALSINNNGTAEDKTDDYVIYTPELAEIDSFYYVITDLDGLKDTALVVLDVKSGSVQQRLDFGETPIEIYNSDNSLLDSLYGKTYQGGLIAYLNTSTGAGLIAAPEDQSVGAEWGCTGTDIDGLPNVTIDPPSGSGAEVGHGATNTAVILNWCTSSGIAAAICASYDDGTWFLPSTGELNLMYTNLYQAGLGGFAADWYWSSTEYDFNDAWKHYFGVGGQDYTDGKYDYNFVRAVRAF
jgi:hypothetical protein